jgi:NAD-dependent dihydropyrimidine dehydrogenase PreA subunit
MPNEVHRQFCGEAGATSLDRAASPHAATQQREPLGRMAAPAPLGLEAFDRLIRPDECNDCGVCVPECPVDAIQPDTEPGLEKWLSLNAEYAKIWPQITVKKTPPPDSKEWAS